MINCVPKLSVIIAAYNTEKYIERCLKSITEKVEDVQNKVEIIVVNDGSTDNTESIVLGYIKREAADYIKLITIENGGPARARNIGVRESKGQYFMFLDSDDFMEEAFVDKIIIAIDCNRPDCCFWGYQEYNENTGEIGNKYTSSFSYIDGEISGKEAFIRKAARNIWIWTGSGCYSKAIYDDMKFDDYELRYGEDYLFIMSFLIMAKKVISIPEIGTNYTVRLNSLMRSGYNDYMLETFQALDILDERIDSNLLKKEAIELKKWTSAEYEIQRLSIAKSIISSNKSLTTREIVKLCEVIPPKRKTYRLPFKKIFESVIFNKMFWLYRKCVDFSYR